MTAGYVRCRRCGAPAGLVNKGRHAVAACCSNKECMESAEYWHSNGKVIEIKCEHPLKSIYHRIKKADDHPG